jgi:pimeloyl-ACP methyl ester carboxylesterase
MRQTAVCVLLLGAVLSGCGGDADGDDPSATSTTKATPASVFAEPTVEGTFEVGHDDVRLSLECWGKGSPVVVLEGGSGESGLGRWKYNPVTEAVAQETQVCAYDRAGTGTSSDAPARARTAEDVVADLHTVLGRAGVSPPLVLGGVSGGGFYAYQYAGTYPDDVAGLVMLETPQGQARMSAKDVRELAWDNPGNDEHVDYVAVEHQMAVARLPIPPIPVTVLTGSHGQSSDDPGSQKVWLTGSSQPRQVILPTGHDIDQESPVEVGAAVLALLDAARQ